MGVLGRTDARLAVAVPGGRLTARGESGRMRAVKFPSPLLLAAFALASCATDSNRRELYCPKKAEGPYTESIKKGSWRTAEVKAANLPTPKRTAR